MTFVFSKSQPFCSLLSQQYNVIQTTTQWSHQFRKVLSSQNVEAVLRLATIDDKKGILDIDRSLFGGMDYLPYWLDRFLVAPNRRCYVGEVGNEIMYFGECISLDGGKRCLYQGGRLKKEYRKSGIIKKLMHASRDAFVEEFPSHQQGVWTLTNINAALLRDSFWESRRLQFLRFHTNFILGDQSQLANKLTSTSSSKVIFNDLTRKDLTDMCHQHKTFPQLFHSKFLLIFYEPFEFMASNVDEIFSKLTYAKRSISSDGRVTGLSFLVESPVSKLADRDERRRVDLDIYSSDTQTVIEHIHYYLNHVVQSKDKYTPMITFTFDKRCDYHRIIDHLNSLNGLQRGPLYPASEVFLMAEDMRLH